MVAALAVPPAKSLRSLEFVLPPEVEAHEPPEARGLARDEVRLLVTHREDDSAEHASFRDLPRFLHAGDLLVVNDSATLPAALIAVRSDGSEIAVHLSTRRGDHVWVVEPRQTAVCAGETVALPGDGSITFDAPYRDSKRLWLARVALPCSPVDYLSAWGRPIKYTYVPGDWPIELYQTVYARRPGSAEMPSAGRAFSRRVLDDLAARGVAIATITLHAGVASLEGDEAPYEEWFEVPPETAAAVNATRERGGRVVAVGTTVVRALESAADATGRVAAVSGWTDLVITPERGVRAVDALLTGFHEPKATHLAMLEAIAGRRHLEAAYGAALAGGYLWHEFGDLHLIV